jgi:hypothetical protein
MVGFVVIENISQVNMTSATFAALFDLPLLDLVLKRRPISHECQQLIRLWMDCRLRLRLRLRLRVDKSVPQGIRPQPLNPNPNPNPKTEPNYIECYRSWRQTFKTAEA